MIPLRAFSISLFALALAVTPCQAAARNPQDGGPEARDIDAFVRKAMARVEVVPGLSVAVVDGDEAVMTSGYGVADLGSGRAVDADTGFYIASATKAFTALAIAAVAERGDLTLDQSLNSWIGQSSLPADIAGSVSLSDLLSHRSGLENQPISFRAAFSGEHTPGKMRALLAQTVRSPTTPYGTFRYTNTGYNLATTLLEVRFGRDWRSLVGQEVLVPAGMTRTTARIDQARRTMLVAAGHTPGPDGRPVPSPLQKTNATMQSGGGLVSTARDMARWLEIQLNDGVVDGHRAFPPGLVNSTHRPLAVQQATFGSYARDGYGLGWQTGRYGPDSLIHHFGSFAGSRAHVSVMPGRRLGVAVMANEDLLAGDLVDLVANYAYDRFAGRPDLEAHYENELAVLTARRDRRLKGLAGSRAERAARPWSLRLPTKAYVGVYRNPAMGRLAVVEQGGRMVIRAGVMASPAEPASEPESVRVELIPVTGQTVRFEAPGRLVVDGQTYVRR